MVEILLMIVALLVVSLPIVVRRGLQIRALALHGVVVQGRVVRRFRSGMAGGGFSRNRRLAFTYRGPDGVEYRRSATVGTSRWEAHAEGDPIELVCLPERPGVSAVKWLVDDARKVLATGRSS